MKRTRKVALLTPIVLLPWSLPAQTKATYVNWANANDLSPSVDLKFFSGFLPVFLGEHVLQDGSAAHPYRDIAIAIAKAGVGDTLSMRSGTYTFPKGRLIISKRLTIQATGGPAVIAPTPLWSVVPDNSYPKYNQVYGTATHNSFWVDRNHNLDIAASGVQELISDQLLHDHVRAIELDVHSEDGPRGVWNVYHTSELSFSQCNPLDDCLEMLRNFHYAIPEHEVINVIIELKNTHAPLPGSPLAANVETNHNFNPNEFVREDDHTVAMFDDTFRRVLGSTLYTPHDFLSRCPGVYTLLKCAKEQGWPTIDRLRGRFIINILGNWSNAAYDWAKYVNETSAGVIDRVAFPMRSIMDEKGNGQNPSYLGQNVADSPAGWIQKAREASIFWQVEYLDKWQNADCWDGFGFMPVEVPTFLAENGIVRGAGSFTPADQEDRIARGFQLTMTDYPWHVIYDLGPSRNDIHVRPRPGIATPVGTPRDGIAIDPSRRLFRPTAPNGIPPVLEAIIEPGDRLYFSADDSKRQFAYNTVPSQSYRFWETTVSTTRRGLQYEKDSKLQFPRNARDDGWGCIQAAANRSNYVEVCRQKFSDPLVSQLSGQNQEQIQIHVRVVRNGQTAASDTTSASLFRTDQVGNFIALEIDNRGSESTVRAYSAGRLDRNWKPDWHQLREEKFPLPMIAQGFAATQDVLFAGPRVREAKLSEARAVNLCDLQSVDVNGASMPAIADLSYPERQRSECAPVPRPLQ